MGGWGDKFKHQPADACGRAGGEISLSTNPQTPVGGRVGKINLWGVG